MATNDKRKVSNGTGDAGSPLDLEVILNILFAGRTTILFALLLTVGVTAVITLFAPRTYESSVKLMVEPRREQGPYQMEIRSYQDRKVFLETVKELLVSQSVLTKTVAQIENRAEDTVTPKDAEQLSEQILLQSRASLTRSLIGGDGIGETSTFFVTVRDSNPQRATTTANTLVEKYLELNAELRSKQVQEATRSLRTSVEDTTRQVKESHAALVAFESEAGPLLPELLNIDKANIRVFPELEDLRSAFENGEIALSERRERVDVLEEAFAQAEAGEALVLPEFAYVAIPALQGLAARDIELSIKANSLLPFYLEESREIQNIRAEMKLTRLEMLNQAKSLATSEQQAVQMLEAAQEARGKSLEGYDEKLIKLSQLNSRYQELKRDYSAKARALDSQIQALAEADSSAAEKLGGHATITVIDRAVENGTPVSPRPVFNMLVALIVGLLLGLLAVLAGHYANPVFIHPRQVEQTTGYPVVGIMPEDKS
jgi:uncharacterized protein involved in exopolysaccharide biosynthesis